MSKLPADMPLITALCARYSLDELIAAQRNDASISLYYYPNGKTGIRKYWRGTPTLEHISAIRILLGAALGRTRVEHVILSGNATAPSPDDRSNIGEIVEGYERIQTFKWNADHVTKKPMPPNSIVWRDIHTGWLYKVHPFTRQQAAEAM
jgi:hypothetical protein